MSEIYNFLTCWRRAGIHQQKRNLSSHIIIKEITETKKEKKQILLSFLFLILYIYNRAALVKTAPSAPDPAIPFSHISGSLQMSWTC